MYMPVTGSPRIAVLIPCYNEQITVATVVSDFRRALPTATSTSTTTTPPTTRRGRDRRGRRGPHARRRGKGNVVRRMFQDIEADIYVMVDGDDTYDAAVAPQLVDTLVDEQPRHGRRPPRRDPPGRLPRRPPPRQRAC